MFSILAAQTYPLTSFDLVDTYDTNIWYSILLEALKNCSSSAIIHVWFLQRLFGRVQKKSSN